MSYSSVLKLQIFLRFVNVFGVQARYHRTNVLWFYNTETEEWLEELTFGESPPPLSSAACGIVNDCLFVFCGFSRTSHYNDKVYRLHLLTKIWTRVFPTSDGIQYPLQEPHPSGRDKLSCFDHDDCLYVFGGYGAVPFGSAELRADTVVDSDREVFMDLKVWHNSLIKFDPHINVFSLVCTRGKAPLPRAACSSCKVGNRFYIFGGRLSTDRMDDMFYLDLNGFVWKRVVKSPCAVWPEGH